VRKRYLSIVAALGLIVSIAGPAAAQSQKFTAMNREVEGFLTGLWAKTSAPADRPPNEAEVTAGLAHCDEPMIDPRSDDKAARALFPSDNASRGDVSMFRSDGDFVLVERMQRPNGTNYPNPKRMSVSAVQQQNRITVRFVSRAQWVNGTWIDQPGPLAPWGDALVGDIDVGGNTEHFFVLARGNDSQTTYIKCGS
jgi:hypothetical protein